MSQIFMIIIILIWFSMIYLEVKNRERSDKIFYTFYFFWMSIIIFPFLKIFDNLIWYLIFLGIYLLLIYWIYTDFEIFTKFWELFLVNKKINKKELLRIDYEFLWLIKEYFKKIVSSFNIKIYENTYKIIDMILIIIWIITIAILINNLLFII